MDLGKGRKRAVRGRAGQQRIAIGYVVRPKGVRGEAVVEPLTGDVDRFDEIEEVTLERSGQPPKRLRIAAWRHDGRGILVKFAGIDSPEAVAGEIAKGYLTIRPRRGSGAARGNFLRFRSRRLSGRKRNRYLAWGGGGRPGDAFRRFAGGTQWSGGGHDSPGWGFRSRVAAGPEPRGGNPGRGTGTPRGAGRDRASQEMRIDVVTIFPEFFRTPLETSMLQRAVAAGRAEICVHDLRQYAGDRHRTVDDAPFGGGGGMVVKPEPVAAAWEAQDLGRGHCIYLTADGEPLNQSLAEQLSLEQRLVLLCGHYKGIDERARRFVDREVSIGDYVLTGGEPAALVLIDAVVRPDSGGARKFHFRPHRLVPRWPARLPMVHTAGRIPRRRGSRRSAERKPRKGHGMAAPAVPAAHLRPPP